MIMRDSQEDLPETPVRLKQRVTTSDENSLHSPSTPSSPTMLQVKYKDYKSAIEAIQQLEIELNEFQQSSYELEKELENELLDLELENTKLKQANDEINDNLKQTQLKQIELESKYNESKAKLVAQIKSLQAELKEKSARLVEIEIINDNFEQNERNYELKYDDIQEKYNQTLEKVIILETEISETNSKLLTEQLKHQNTQNELNEYKTKYEDLVKTQPQLKVGKVRSNSQTQGQSSSRQPSGSREPSGPLPTSSSLMALHTLVGQSQGLGSRLGSLKSSLTNSALKARSVSKSTPTTKLSNEHVTISTPLAVRNNPSKIRHNPETSTSIPIASPGEDPEQNTFRSISRSAPSQSRRTIPSSPSSFQLSAMMNNKHLTNITNLEAIEGSPNKELYQLTAENKDNKNKNNIFGSLMTNPFKSKHK